MCHEACNRCYINYSYHPTQYISEPACLPQKYLNTWMLRQYVGILHYTICKPWDARKVFLDHSGFSESYYLLLYTDRSYNFWGQVYRNAIEHQEFVSLTYNLFMFRCSVSHSIESTEEQTEIEEEMDWKNTLILFMIYL